MGIITLLLLVAAFILFVLAAIGVGGGNNRFNLVAAGLACWVLTALLSNIS